VHRKGGKSEVNVKSLPLACPLLGVFVCVSVSVFVYVSVCVCVYCITYVHVIVFVDLVVDFLTSHLSKTFQTDLYR